MSTIRQLRPGEQIPTGPPRRYRAGHGYVRLRWTVSPGQEVETYEHRVIGDRVTTADEVHHKNGIRDDNRPENLEHLTSAEHHAVHAPAHAAAIVREYLAGDSTPVLARRYRISTTVVTRILEHRGVQRRSPSWYRTQVVDLEEVRRLHAAGVRAGRMCRLLGVGRTCIYRAFDELGLPRFPAGRIGPQEGAP